MKRLFSLCINEHRRKNLITFLIVSQSVEFGTGCLLCIIAVLVKMLLGYKMSFLERYYNPWIVPVILIMTGIAVMLTSILGIKFCFHCFQNNTGFTETQSINKNYFYFFIMNSISLLSKTVTVLVFIYQLQIIHSALKKGIADAIRSYRTDSVIKEELDVMQMKYACCGLESYKDWFHIKWIEDKYFNKDRLEKAM